MQQHQLPSLKKRSASALSYATYKSLMKAENHLDSTTHSSSNIVISSEMKPSYFNGTDIQAAASNPTCRIESEGEASALAGHLQRANWATPPANLYNCTMTHGKQPVCINDRCGIEVLYDCHAPLTKEGTGCEIYECSSCAASNAEMEYIR